MQTIRVEFAKNARKGHGGDIRAQPRKPRTTTQAAMESIEERKIAFGEVLKQACFFMIWRLEMKPPNSGGNPGVPLRAAIKRRRGLRIAPLLGFLVILIKKKQAACEYK